MKKIILILILLSATICEFNADAQNVYTNQDGVVCYYQKPALLMLDLLYHIQVQYSLVKMEKDGEDLGYAFLIISNYNKPTVTEGKNILFRLENQEVIKCPAMRTYDENDRFEVQNATSDAANQKCLQAYYKISDEDLQKIMNNKIIKMRVEFDANNLDLDEKKCKSLSKNIANAYQTVNSIKENNIDEF